MAELSCATLRFKIENKKVKRKNEKGKLEIVKRKIKNKK